MACPTTRLLLPVLLVLSFVAQADKPGQGFKDCPDCPEMVRIPAGSFRMGDLHDDGNPSEKPVRQVSVRSFALARTEVTQAQWLAVMGRNPSYFKTCDDCPVEHVSWNDAQEFLRKLAQKSGQRYRLPSEAEWEFACRAGGAHKYCGGDDLNAVAWYRENTSKPVFDQHKAQTLGLREIQATPQPVGRKQPNAYGLHDMTGNVWEWTQDCWNENYDRAPIDGRARDTESCGVRVARGGAYKDSLQNSRAALRGRFSPEFRIFILGLRVARD